MTSPSVQRVPVLGTGEPTTDGNVPPGEGSQNDNVTAYGTLFEYYMAGLRPPGQMEGMRRFASTPSTYSDYDLQAARSERLMAALDLLNPTATHRILDTIEDQLTAITERLQAEIVALNATDPAAARRRALECNDEHLARFEEEEAARRRPSRPARALGTDNLEDEIALLEAESSAVMRTLANAASRSAALHYQWRQTVGASVRNAVLRQPHQPIGPNARGFTWNNGASPNPLPPITRPVSYAQAENAPHNEGTELGGHVRSP